ncbi:MAG TPA: N-acetylmuramoyl-L-alanine amidase, partial [Chloroflexota bacterium]
MPSIIRPSRLDVSDRFPILGFNVRTETSPKWFEVVLATDPSLVLAGAKAQRTASTFWSSRGQGPLKAERGEAVYLVPAGVLARFIGKPKLYFGLATFSRPDQGDAQIDVLPNDRSPWVNIENLSGRTMRRALGVPNVGGGLGGGGTYGASDGAALTWAGDSARPGSEPVGGATQPAPPAASLTPGAPAAQSSYGLAVAYDDGHGRWPEEPLPAPDEVAPDADPGIDGPIPDYQQGVLATGLDANAVSQPEYAGASRFVQARFYRTPRAARTISRVVIHITDGGANINGTIAWFRNPVDSDGKIRQVSAHYVVGRDGEVVQMVRHTDVAFHAHHANADSIGIEHCANTRGLRPTEAEYCASATLVRAVCDQYGIPLDRAHIQGHSEADPTTTHSDCPNAVWDWAYFMGMVTSGACYPMPAAQSYANGLAHTVAPARPAPLSTVQPEYVPSDPQQALAVMRDFQDRKLKWSAGVLDTAFFPHSAICQLVIGLDDGNTGIGTGAYIAPNRILTCGHNVAPQFALGVNATSITVIPGKNGPSQSSHDEPFSRFAVPKSGWHPHPRYDGSPDFDLAVLEVDVPPPFGAYFDILEELRSSQPAPIVVCGYAAVTVDENKQHLDGDMIRRVEDNTFEYNLQTEPGNSGSPVYYVWAREDDVRRQSVLESHLVGVHVAGFDERLNRACRLTDDKIRWIWSVGQGATSAGLSASRVSPSRTSSRSLQAAEAGAAIAGEL